ncbi:hypothetical protein SCOR_29530 [Sulfidibacter corallicola]|uniref:Uncharacterized protein n=1 Tax=Sulfidibacter corallicola TaxID=2818388 RepID=A0A8A4TMG9_SULCO|nr:class I SAM-dependent methyltransferase [Sulfidibacter corallicola]QTD50302.1 hypothetical protein J3U87_32355 [Sulfidibacter corallicola]
MIDMDGLIEEFSGLTNNEAFLRAFTDRVLLLNPDPDFEDPFLGNTQRRDFLPHLVDMVSSLREDGPTRRIFDLGAGKGEIVDLVLDERAPMGTRVSIEEPNPNLMQRYVHRIERSQRLQLGEVFPGDVQSMYHLDLPAEQDLVLAIHMVYHLTDWRCASADPAEDLRTMVGFSYGLLRPGGRLFLVYADQTRALAGLVGLYFYRTRWAKDPSLARDLARIYRARNSLLADGGIVPELAIQYPDRPAEIEVHRLPSMFYGKTLADLAAMSLVGELIGADDEPFELDKLVAAGEFLSRHGAEVGLRRDDEPGPRQGMWCADQPQVVVIITRTR